MTAMFQSQFKKIKPNGKQKEKKLIKKLDASAANKIVFFISLLSLFLGSIEINS